MSEILELNAAPRAEKIATQDLRANKIIPAVIYGHGFENQNIQVEYLPFEKILSQAGESTLVELKIGADIRKVLIQDVQRDPVTDRFLHADFRQVRLDEKVKAEVELKFVGEAPAVKEHGGIFVSSLEKVEIEALPTDLVHEIEVDITGLTEIGAKLHLKDLKISNSLEMIDDPELMVAIIEPPRVEEEAIAEAKPEDEEKAAIEAQASQEGAEPAEGEAESKKTKDGAEPKPYEKEKSE